MWWCAQGNSINSFEEHFVRGALRLKSGSLDLEIQQWIVEIARKRFRKLSRTS